MPTVTVTLHPPYDGDYARHGVEFSSVHFNAPVDIDSDWLEMALRELPGCATLIEFKFSPDTGEGRFILLDSVVSPGDYELRGPVRHVLQVDGRFRHNGKQYGQILTHIETDMWHALCGAEMGSTVTDRLENMPVTCPACRQRWRQCQVYGRADFETLSGGKETISSGQGAKQTPDVLEKKPDDDVAAANMTTKDARKTRSGKWGAFVVVIILILAFEIFHELYRVDHHGLPQSCDCMPG